MEEKAQSLLAQSHRTQDTEGTIKPFKKYTPGQDMFSTIVVQPLSRKHLAKTYL